MLAALGLLGCSHPAAPKAPPYAGPCTIRAKYFVQNPNGTWGSVNFDWKLDQCPEQITVVLPDGEQPVYGEHP